MRISLPRVVLGILISCHLGATAARSDDITPGRKAIMKVKVEDVQVNADVLFYGDYALTRTDGEPDCLFNLKELWWHDIETGTRKTLEESKKWHAASREKSLKSLANVKDEAQRKFTEALINPQLKVAEKDDGLIMSNAAVVYELRPLVKVPEDFADKLFAYNTLNAYQTAIIQRQVPPDAGLAVAEELARRKVYPRTMLVTLKTARKDVKFDVTMEIVDLSEEEAMIVSERVAKLKK